VYVGVLSSQGVATSTADPDLGGSQPAQHPASGLIYIGLRPYVLYVSALTRTR
jgi:hypothetical protein